MYKVMLLNDDFTPMEFVVHILERFFGLNHAQSFGILLLTKSGSLLLACFPFEIAETKVAQVMDFAPPASAPAVNAPWKKNNILCVLEVHIWLWPVAHLCCRQLARLL